MNITTFRLGAGHAAATRSASWPPGAHHQHHLGLACLGAKLAAASRRALTGFRLAGPGMQRPPGAHHEHHLALTCLGTELAAASARIMNIIWPWLASGPNSIFILRSLQKSIGKVSDLPARSVSSESQAKDCHRSVSHETQGSLRQAKVMVIAIPTRQKTYHRGLKNQNWILGPIIL